MKGNITNKILDVLSSSLLTTADLITTILESGYGTSEYKLSKNFDRIQKNRLQRELNYRERQRFSNLISKLKRDGLVVSENKKWKLTSIGREKLRKRKLDLIFAEKNYSSEKNNVLNLIIFDIPEREKRKRIWLRDSLVNLGFEILQKSVWVGKTKIPVEFIGDLKKLDILKFVHIFSVQKYGTILGDDI